jgi:integrase/recombinase XerD
MTTTAIATTTATTVVATIAQADSDQHLVSLWLANHRSTATRKAYAGDIAKFGAFVGAKALRQVTVADVIEFGASLAAMAPASQKRIVNAVKSLLSFAERIGYLPVNVGAVVETVAVKDTLAERILDESDVLRMIAMATSQREAVLLRTLYASAGRVSEISGLVWRDVIPNGESGQVVLYGKGGKTRSVLLSKATYKALLAMRNGADANDPVFVSQKGSRLSVTQIWRIVAKAAQRAGIEGNVSPHWFRHSHASHALTRGASVALVRDTLGHESLTTTSKYLHAKPTDSSSLHLAV